MARDLRAGQASGEIRDDIDLRLLVQIIVAVMDGLQNQWLLDDDVDMLAGFQLFHDLLVTALGGDAAPATVTQGSVPEPPA